MKRKWPIVIFFITVLLLITAVSCGSDKELWEVLEDAQYSSYKPRLDHMIKKYGDIFEMDVYGTVTCTDPEYKDWRISLGGDADGSTTDNFAIRLRRDDIEFFIQEIAAPIFGECKVYVTRGRTSTLDADADTEDFFTYEYSLVSCWIYVPYNEDYQAQGEAFMASILERNYSLCLLDILYVDREQYEQVNRGDINLAIEPKDYQFRLDAWFDDGDRKFSFKWHEAEG